MNLTQRLAAWHQTRTGLLVFGLVELAAAGLFLFWALSDGRILDWICLAILVAGFTQNFIRFGRMVKNGNSNG